MKHSAINGQDVPRETLRRLRLYEALLFRWNSTINLVSRHDLDSAWDRHFEDSLQLVRLLPASAVEGVDLGSGAGFPGLVVAIAADVHFTLVEADRRKAAFLRAVIAATGAPADVRAARIETVKVEECDVLTARALAPLDRLLALGNRLLKPDGVAFFHKGKNAADEVAEARENWNMQIVEHPSAVHPEGVILEITGLSPRAR